MSSVCAGFFPIESIQLGENSIGVNSCFRGTHTNRKEFGIGKLRVLDDGFARAKNGLFTDLSTVI